MQGDGIEFRHPEKLVSDAGELLCLHNFMPEMLASFCGCAISCQRCWRAFVCARFLARDAGELLCIHNFLSELLTSFCGSAFFVSEILAGFCVSLVNNPILVFLHYAQTMSKKFVIGRLHFHSDIDYFLICTFSGNYLVELKKRCTFAASKREI